ncbi:MAG: hypothetical protein HDT27_04955 [Subdoligranulum sp.]|nr:hypothetical protein [Subdoligranulum sp.]
MANGRVKTGFSKPYVAKYAANGGDVSYTGCMPMARGVSVEFDLNEPSDNDFYADNVTAESAPGKFTGGNANLTVDGLKYVAERFMLGLPEPTQITVDGKQVNVTDYGEAMEIPYVGIGFLVRYMEDGVESWEPVRLNKARLSTPGLNAQTQEEEIDWQTEDLAFALQRDDTPEHNWKRVADAQATEEMAEKVLKALLGGDATAQPEALEARAEVQDAAANVMELAEVPTKAPKKKASGGEAE